MAIKIISITSKGIVVSAGNPSYTAKENANLAGVKIVGNGYGYSKDSDFLGQSFNPRPEDAFTMSEMVSFEFKYGRELLDSVAISETFAASTIKAVEDILNLSEVTSKYLSKVEADIVTFTEDISFVRTIFLSFEDTFTLLEDFSNTNDIFEYARFTEDIGLLLSKSFTDTIAISESVGILANSTVADTVTFAEQSSINLSVVGPTDTVTMSETGQINVQSYFAGDYVVNDGVNPYVSSYLNSL